MPRHLLRDAHGWINEIPTVLIYYLPKPQPRVRAWDNQRGEEDPVHVDSSPTLCNGLRGVPYVGASAILKFKYS